MNPTLRRDADAIIRSSLNAVLPDEAVRRALKAFAPKGGRVLLVAAGKAAWQMAHAAVEALGRVDGGVVVTKYGHVKGEIPGVTCCEAGHPVPDENSFAATEKALALVQGLTAEDTVLFLLSGGGSALFERPLLPGEEPMVVEIPAEDAEIDDELHHLPPEDEVEEIDGSPEEENPDEPTGILPDEENMETETLEIDDELHHLPPEDDVEEID